MSDEELKELFYKEALSIMGSDRDWKALCAILAAADPEAFCKALNVVPWQLTAKKIYAIEGKVAAIKYIRNENGVTLKYAKDAIEILCEGKDPEAEG